MNITEETNLFEAAKSVALAEEAMCIAQDAYQIAYDDFKAAQQKLHDAQTAWFKAEQAKQGENSDETSNSTQ